MKRCTNPSEGDSGAGRRSEAESDLLRPDSSREARRSLGALPGDILEKRPDRTTGTAANPGRKLQGIFEPSRSNSIGRPRSLGASCADQDDRLELTLSGRAFCPWRGHVREDSLRPVAQDGVAAAGSICRDARGSGRPPAPVGLPRPRDAAPPRRDPDPEWQRQLDGKQLNRHQLDGRLRVGEHLLRAIRDVGPSRPRVVASPT